MSNQSVSQSEASSTALGRVEKNKQRVCGVAAELFVQHSFDAVTIEMILVEAKIARSTFYRFFTDKDDLLKHILVPVFELMAQKVESVDESEPESIINGIAHAYIDAWSCYEHRLLLATTLLSEKTYPLVKEPHDRYAMRIFRLMEALNEVRLLRNDDPRLSAMLLSQIGVKMLQIHLKHPHFANAYCSALRGLLLKW